ncbi:MAG: T9SS type A sorting domain-containing protein [Bacteroidales bacterium]|nr:T9SS type A sorting domain-containing protein [Bacteroidales bacterium]
MYGGAENGHVNGNTDITLTKGLIGHAMYGGGKGKGEYEGQVFDPATNTYSTKTINSITAGKVYGSTNILIEGGYLVRSVFGGGNLASVGIGNYAGDDYNPSGYGEPQAAASYSNDTIGSGSTYINITGGVLGMLPVDNTNPDGAMKDGVPYGSVFGGCRGVATPEVEPEQIPYLFESRPDVFLGYVNNTHVKIGATGTEGPRLYGSVYGGGQDGHVRYDAHTVVNSGTIGANYGTDDVGSSDINSVYWTDRGNVFGGGSGIGLIDEEDPNSYSSEAGSIIQNATVIINGGTIHRNVYGGGNLASVGPKRIGESDCDSTLTKVKVIVNNDVVIGHTEYGGNVFGGARGKASSTDEFANFGLTPYTEVSINGEAQVKNSVYGGGEYGNVGVHGSAYDPIHSSEVNINGGTVDGSVYGAGYMGRNFGETYANISGGTVNNYVFGGAYGEEGNVYVLGLSTVNMRGGTVTKNVYGGSYKANDALTFGTVDEDATETASLVNISGGTVTNNVFGAGYYGRTYGSTYVFIGTDAIEHAPNNTFTNTAPYNEAYYANHQNLVIGGNVWAGADFGDFDSSSDVFGDYTISGRSHIYIDGNGYNTETTSSTTTQKYMMLSGSVYGSGTLNDSGHQGKLIMIRNYGKALASTAGLEDQPWGNATRTLGSIQYADSLIIENSHINLTGQGIVNIFATTEHFSIYNIFNDVRVLNGSSVFVDKPIKNIGNLHSNTCENLYAAEPSYAEVSRTALITIPGNDNKIRINNGSYITVSMTQGTTTTYGALRGFFYLMSDGDYNAFAYARPKDSDEEGNGVLPEHDNPTDGGFVNYNPTFNTFDVNGALVDAGSSYQMPYENHTPKQQQRNGENYFRVWRYLKQGTSVFEVVIYATADPTHEHGFSYGVPLSLVDLPPRTSSTSYYRIKTDNGAPDIEYGSEVLTVNAGMQEEGTTPHWMYYLNDGATNGFVYNDDGSSSNLTTGKTLMTAHPNTVFGLTAIPMDGLAGESNKPLLFCPDATNALATAKWYNSGQSPKIQFLLTHSNDINGNFTWDPITITMEQVYENGADIIVTDTAIIHVTIITETIITQPNNLETYAMMTHKKGTGDPRDVYTAKVQLPRFELYEPGVESEWTLTNVTWHPNETEGANQLYTPAEPFNSNTLVSGEPYDLYLAHTVDTTHSIVGMKMYTTKNYDDQNGWYDEEHSATNPLNLGELKGTTFSPIKLGTSKYNATMPVSFNFDLHYDGDQNAEQKGNAWMGTLELTVHLTNYKYSTNTGHGQDVTFNVDVYRRGKGRNFYIDGVHGNFLYSGHYPNAAQPSLAGILQWTTPKFEPSDTIYIVNTVTASSALTTWDGTNYDQFHIYRYNGGHALTPETDPALYYKPYGTSDYRPDNEAFKGALVEVKGTMKVSSTALDGSYLKPEMDGSAHVVEGNLISEAPLINVKPGGTLVLKGGNETTSYLRNNYNAGSNGGAISIESGGTVKMNEHAFVHNNFVKDGASEPHYGAGVYMAGTANMLVSDDAFLVDTDLAEHSNKHVTSAGVVDLNQNVYLANYETYISVGTLDALDSYGPLNDNVRIGVTKPLSVWADLEYVPVVFTENTDHWTNLFGDHIIYDEHDGNVLDIYPERDPNGDPNYLKKLYWIRTWVKAVTKNPCDPEHPNAFSFDNVDTPEKLAWVISLVNGLNGAEAVPTRNFTITKDIDMSRYIWVPIGTADEQYSGIFEGNGHAVTGIHSQLSVDDKGMFGTTNGATIQNLQAKVNFYRGEANNLGSLIGNMTGGKVINCEGAGYLETGKSGSKIGGLVGTTTAASLIHSSFAADTLCGLASNIVMGGLVADNPGNLLNAYSRVRIKSGEDGNKATHVGGLVGDNKGLVENCYAEIGDLNIPAFAYTNTKVGGDLSGVIQYCYTNTRTDEGAVTYVPTDGMGEGSIVQHHGVFNPVLGRKDVGYMYYDNSINLAAGQTNTFVPNALDYEDDHHTIKWNGMLYVLNNWVNTMNGSSSAYASYQPFTSWFRPTSGIINSDLPVLGFPKDNSMATLDSDSLFLHYGAADFVADHASGTNNGLDQLLPVYNDKSASIFLYDNATDVNQVPGDNVKVFVNEDAVLMQTYSTSMPEFKNTTVGITFDNSCRTATTMGQTLLYDWHLLSSPLSNAPIGINYLDEVAQNYWNTGDNGQIDPDLGVEGSYMPSRVDTLNQGNLNLNPQDIVLWDFYTYYEREYHWINFKRNSLSHHHYDYPHHIIYYDNEEFHVSGKGYMMAISKDSYLSNTGSLNKGDITIPVTATAPEDTSTDYSYNKGSNLVGNPFQAYLDLDALAAENLFHVVDDKPQDSLKFFYVYDADEKVYVPYTEAASVNPRLPSRYIHPHQGFFVLYRPKDPENESVDMKINLGMATTKKEAESYFRGDDKSTYPLVNIIASDEDGNRDLAIIELGRPTLGGVEKVENLQNSDFKLYSHLGDNNYSLLFTPVGTPRIPLFFKTPHDGTYTFTWDTHNGTFEKMLLIDNLTGAEYDMLAHDSYTFTALATDYAARFYIVFSVAGKVNVVHNGNDNFAFFDGTSWVIEGSGQLELIDATGRVLSSQKVSGEQTRVSFDYAAGPYTLRLVQSRKNVKTQKIVIY